MSRQTFEHAVFIHAAPGVCSTLFFEPANFTRTNPLVADVQDVTPGQTAEGQPFYTFYVVDKIPILGSARLPFKYWVRMTLTRDEAHIKEIVSETRSFPNVMLHNVVTFMAENGGTTVHESVRIETSPLLLGFSVQQAKQSHAALLGNLKVIAEQAYADSHSARAEGVGNS